MQITEPCLWAPQCSSCGVCIQRVTVSAWLLLLKSCPACIAWLFIKCNLFISLPASPDCLPAFPCLLDLFPCACTTFAISFSFLSLWHRSPFVFKVSFLFPRIAPEAHVAFPLNCRASSSAESSSVVRSHHVQAFVCVVIISQTQCQNPIAKGCLAPCIQADSSSL